MRTLFRVGCCLYIVSILMAGAFYLRAEPVAGRINIKAVNGNASYSSDGIHFNAIHSGEVIPGPGSIIKTSDRTTVDLVLQSSGTVLRMRPNTTLKVAKLNEQPAGEQMVSESSLKLLKGSIIGAQRKLAVPSHFDIAMSDGVATIVGTEYVINADGAVSVLDGQVSVNYNLPGNKGSVKVSIPQGSTFDPATGQVVPTSSAYLQNLIADINTVKQNAKVFKAGHATIVVKPEEYISPIHCGDGHENGRDNNHGHNDDHGHGNGHEK